jgi:hypothetical protein
MPPSPTSQSPDDEIHLQTPFGQQLRVTRRELKDMLRRNALAPGTQFFEEGMSGWQPLRGIRQQGGTAAAGLASRRLAAARKANPGIPICTFARDPNRLTGALKFFLWLYLFFCAALAVSHLAEHLLLNRDYAEPELALNGTRQGLLGLASMAVFLFTAALFFRWVYRAYFNCMEFATQDLSTSPGWAVAHYFLPIICFFRPYDVMREIDRVSQNPLTWQELRAHPIVSCWWFFWLLNLAACFISIRLGWGLDSAHPDWAQRRGDLALVNAAIALLQGVLTVSLLALVSRVTFNQNALVRDSEKILQDTADPQDPSERKQPKPNPKPQPPTTGADPASPGYSPA